MGLQIRVRHALGERVIELPDRMAEEPVIVGRASNAEVSVPSVTVAPKHCVLFIHEGHWAVQDLGAGGGTYVNGEPALEARFLQIGDVITVGSDTSAPTIEVDPAAAAEGRTGFAGTGLPHLQAQEAAPGYGAFAPAAAPSMVPGPMYGAPGYTAPAMAARSAPEQHYAGAYDPHAAHAEHHNGEHHHDDAVHFEPAAVSTRPYARRKQGGSAGVVVGMVVAAVVVVGGVWGIVAYLKNANDEKVAAVQREQQRLNREAEEAAAAAKKKAAQKPSNIFGIEKTGSTGTGQTTSTTPPRPDTPFKPAPRIPNGGSPGNPPVTPVTPPPEPKTTTPDSDPVTPPKSTTPDSDPVTPKTPAKPKTPDDGMDVRKPTTPAGSGDGMDTVTKKPTAPAIPAGKDPETMDPAAAASWQAMQDLAKQPGKESFAVLRFEDFRRLNPGLHDADIDKFVDQKLDRIWWERIDLLMKKIERLNMEIPKLREEIVDINDPAVKKAKLEQFKKMEEDLKLSAKTLKETMKYDSSDAPNLNSESELATLAAKRNKEAYETWKKITTNYIKANQGRLAWANEF